MKMLTKKIVFIVVFIIFGLFLVGPGIAGVGYSSFREGDIVYIDEQEQSFAYWGHVGILYKKDGMWWVRESRWWPDFRVVSRKFTSFYGRYATKGWTVKLLRVNNCSPAQATQAANLAKRLPGMYSYPGNMPMYYSCSSFVWAAYKYGPGIDIRKDPQVTPPNLVLPREISESLRTRDLGRIDMGDINADGFVNVVDVQACVNHILGLQNWGSRADVTGDGSVYVNDLQAIVNIILCV